MGDEVKDTSGSEIAALQAKLGEVVMAPAPTEEAEQQPPLMQDVPEQQIPNRVQPECVADEDGDIWAHEVAYVDPSCGLMDMFCMPSCDHDELLCIDPRAEQPRSKGKCFDVKGLVRSLWSQGQKAKDSLPPLGRRVST